LVEDAIPPLSPNVSLHMLSVITGARGARAAGLTGAWGPREVGNTILVGVRVAVAGMRGAVGTTLVAVAGASVRVAVAGTNVAVEVIVAVTTLVAVRVAVAGTNVAVGVMVAVAVKVAVAPTWVGFAAFTVAVGEGGVGVAAEMGLDPAMTRTKMMAKRKIVLSLICRVDMCSPLNLRMDLWINLFRK
jgi:hypothetical protein